MDFRILGPLEVWRDGRRVALPGARQRALLAILLLHAGEVVASDRLMDALWGERAPAAGHTALRVRPPGHTAAATANHSGSGRLAQRAAASPSGLAAAIRPRR